MNGIELDEVTIDLVAEAMWESDQRNLPKWKDMNKNEWSSTIDEFHIAAKAGIKKYLELIE